MHKLNVSREAILDALMTIYRTSSNLYRLEPTQSTLMVTHTNVVNINLHGKSSILPELGGHVKQWFFTNKL